MKSIKKSTANFTGIKKNNAIKFIQGYVIWMFTPISM